MQAFQKSMVKVLRVARVLQLAPFICAFSLTGCQSNPKAEPAKSPLEQVTVAQCAADWTEACESAINAPPPEDSGEFAEPVKKNAKAKSKKFKRKKIKKAIEVDDLFKGDIELSIPGSAIDTETHWDGAFGGGEEESK